MKRKPATAILLVSTLAFTMAVGTPFSVSAEGTESPPSEVQEEIDETAVPIREELETLSLGEDQESSTQSDQEEGSQPEETDTSTPEPTQPEEETEPETSETVTEELQTQTDQPQQVTETPALTANNVLRSGESQPTANSVASVEMNGATTYYDTLNEAVHTVSDSGGTATITLLKDASLTGFSSATGTELLNGNITFIGGNHTVTGDNLCIFVGGTLTIESGNFVSTAWLSTFPGGTINVRGGTINRLERSTGGGNINISGGTVDILRIYSTYLTGSVTISGGTVNTITGSGSETVQYNPDFDVSVQSVTAGTITVIPLSNTTTFGNAQYSLDNQTWQDSNVFNTCKAGTQYTIYARYSRATNVVESTTTRTSEAAFTVTIPATTLTAGESTSTTQISVNAGNNFDLGYGGMITVSASESVTLTRKNDPTTTLTSALLVNGTRHTGGTVITFNQENYQSASATIQFEKPVLLGGGTIPAGR